MDLVTILAFVCLVSAVITYGLGVSVYTKNSRSEVNRLFLVAMLAATWWAAGEFLTWQSTSPEELKFWLKASSVWTLALVFTLHFILSFTRNPFSERRNLKYLVAFLYVPAILIALLEIFTDLVFTVRFLPGHGYVYVPVTDSPAILVQALLFLSIAAFILQVDIAQGNLQGKKRERDLNLLVNTGLVLILFSGLLSEYVLPRAGIYVPNLIFIGFVCFSAIITYAIVRCGLFTLSPEHAVSDILRTMPDSLILADTEGRIIVSNRAADALFWKTPADMRSESIGTLLPRQAGDAIRKALRERSTFADIEAILDTQDYRVVSIAGSPVLEPSGETAGIVLIIRDITGRMASERALRLVNEKLSLLSQLTRHDINNLIMALNGYLDLSREAAESSVVKQYISACQGIVGKIENHLRFSRQYEEIGRHDPSWQSAGNLAEQAIADLDHGAVKILRELPPVEIYADPLTVKVFYNLLENALRHGRPLTEIRISSDGRADGELVIVVEDNGPGIPDGEKEKIFTRFYGKNTGLGLAFSRDILSVTGISIAETGVFGSGARFEIVIPHRSWRHS